MTKLAVVVLYCTQKYTNTITASTSLKYCYLLLSSQFPFNALKT